MKRAKGGFLTVEAGLVLPVFLIAVLTLGGLIQAISAEETLTHVTVNQARRISAEAGLKDIGWDGLPDELGKLAATLTALSTTPLTLENRVKGEAKEEGFDPASFRVTEYKYLYQEKNMEDLILAKVKMDLDLPFPALFINSFEREQSVLFRGFTGKRSTGAAADFSDMEKEGDGRLVWVFPRAGERFHKESCKVINVMARERMLTKALLKEYDPCRLCRPDSTAVGSLVYCFPAAGTSFHKSDCHSVSRYVERMEQKDAEIRGYSACKVCGG